MDREMQASLRAISPQGAIWLTERLRRHGVFDATADEVAADADIPFDVARAQLEYLADAGVLERAERYCCPGCSTAVLADNIECSLCGSNFDAGPVTTVTYQRRTAPGRDVPWMLLIHGMNTRGAWQEQFAWRAAIVHGRSIPVFSFKYGRIRPGVLLARRRRQLIRRTIGLITELAGDADSVHLGTRPDVIAHSFGTWLIVHALLDEPTLQIGRLVLTGSIIRPDFDWSRIADQHDGVLNHRAGSDHVVGAARFFIPDCGPSGIDGFTDKSIDDALAPTWHHSDYFKPTANLQLAFDTVWAPYLRAPR